MATNLDIVKRALRKVIALAGASEAPADEAADGMTLLNGLFGELIGGGTLGTLNDVIADADYTAREWDRIRAANGVTVTLPTTITTSTYSGNAYPYNDGPDYGWGCSYSPRPPFNLAPVVVIQGDGGDPEIFTETRSIYSAYAGGWVTINGLDLQDTFPLPQHLENGFAAMLAEYAADEFGVEVGEQTKRQAAYCRVALTHRYDSARRPVYADYF